uniref:Uncharacterized protein n=1 Tax=Rhizophora mucronata TaxID=61149 RepID=A0A2P2MIL9_RHIMU
MHSFMSTCTLMVAVKLSIAAD